MMKKTNSVFGFNVLEMIIVLAVVATAVALVLPTIFKSLSRTELDQAAKQVRDGLQQARAAAIGSGVPHEFRYQPGGRRWEVAPQASQSHGSQEIFPAATPTVANTESVAEAKPDPSSQPVVIEDQLPGGVVFADPWDQEPKLVPEEASQSALSAETAAADAWAPAIVFYPNGRSSDERIRLLGAHQSYVDVTLRGLTGIGFIGEVGRLTPSAGSPGPVVVTEELLP